MDTRATKIVMISIIAVGVLVIVVVPLLILNDMTATNELYYADGFTVEKFKKLHPGMMKEQVRKLMGEPIQYQNAGGSSWFSDGHEVWYYSSIGWSDPAPDYQHGVEFDKQGKVVKVTWPEVRKTKSNRR